MSTQSDPTKFTELTCARCGKLSRRYTSTIKGRRTHYCSAACQQSARAVEWRDFACENCGTSFRAKQDHGAWPRFCSRTCFCASARFAKCHTCGKEYRLTKRGRGDASSKYCSLGCLHQASLVRRERTCLNCGKVYHGAVLLKKKPENGYCSRSCMTAFARGARSHSYKGGRYIDSLGKVVVRVGEKHYRHEHRVVVEKALGRPLQSAEIIVHISTDTTDNALSNLFVYSSRGEYNSAQHNGIRPARSNLDPLTYQQPSTRGQTNTRQKDAVFDEPLPRPPIAPWHQGRKEWIAAARKKGDLTKTRGLNERTVPVWRDRRGKP